MPDANYLLTALGISLAGGIGGALFSRYYEGIKEKLFPSKIKQLTLENFSEDYLQ